MKYWIGCVFDFAAFFLVLKLLFVALLLSDETYAGPVLTLTHHDLGLAVLAAFLSHWFNFPILDRFDD